MTDLSNLTTTQLRNMVATKEQIEALQSQLDSIAGEGEIPSAFAEEAQRKAAFTGLLLSGPGRRRLRKQVGPRSRAPMQPILGR